MQALKESEGTSAAVSAESVESTLAVRTGLRWADDIESIIPAASAVAAGASADLQWGSKLNHGSISSNLGCFGSR